ncbi:iron uptake protein [Pseudothauera rhizosphaerae]|uniref:iron uptake protein n=1 Tax=Pseudothauera rhizosphaerae TaxID=2565932 RepID=UPI001B3B28C7|nr:iron uptake protein [Pseudothauera rhizosphaerae]
MTDPSPRDAALPHGPGPHAALRGRTRPSILHRVAAALLGGYAFTWGFTTLGVAGLVALGVDFHEAETALLLLAFLVFLSLFLWAFAAASLVRVWAVLGGGAVCMTVAALALQRVLLT